MKIYKVLTDEYPESCQKCPLCTRFNSEGSLKGFGHCQALDGSNNIVCTQLYADYRRHDCPLTKVKAVGGC